MHPALTYFVHYTRARGGAEPAPADFLFANPVGGASTASYGVASTTAGSHQEGDGPVTDEIETLAKSDEGCRRVMTVPGIGPIISSAMVAAIGNGAAFARGRDFSAWIGLVPKQMSTGDRTILGRITKRGNGYLRTLFVQAARVILLRPASWPKHGFGVWLARAAQRLHRNVLAAALANKLARIAWTVLAQERSYEARIVKAAA